MILGAPLTRLSRFFRKRDPGRDAARAQGRASLEAAVPLRPAAPWDPTHRHRKGGLYRVLAQGILEADRRAAVIYDDAEGTIWIRPAEEFNDGRFELLPVQD
ncbi:DUF1653 domain-containing protein [Roseobacter sinensis]|uniref:DUF1653 domain-containing protein n=1 Tax=Roseobacter sinensis TaxID=2931391 RepID=A0ABT3BG64_9RHOB|nr:DUF1653 domain-containing protein [Roseobacter sp. WL0113]MCV3272548.1 DUF1653 domain-containing protein [Roseobacter sp. WL0113]